MPPQPDRSAVQSDPPLSEPRNRGRAPGDQRTLLSTRQYYRACHRAWTSTCCPHRVSAKDGPVRLVRLVGPYSNQRAPGYLNSVTQEAHVSVGDSAHAQLLVPPPGFPPPPPSLGETRNGSGGSGGEGGRESFEKGLEPKYPPFCHGPHHAACSSYQLSCKRA